MQLSISTKLVLLVTLLVTASVTTISYYLYQNGSRILVEHELQDLSHTLQREGDQLTSRITELKRDALFLADSPPIHGLIRAGQNRGYDLEGKSSRAQWLTRLTSLFQTMLSTNPDYYQVRLLDANGQEVLKLAQTNGSIQRFPRRALQNKSQMPYFQAAKSISQGQLYISPIQLNREFGKISLPHMPVLRCATPVYHAGKLSSILIINLNFTHYLSQMEKAYGSSNETLYVTNSSGAYLSHPDPNKRFAFELGHHFRIQEDFPTLADLFAPSNSDLSRNIIPEDSTGKIMVFVKIPLEENYADKFIAVGLEKSYVQILASVKNITQRSLAIIILFILLSIIFALGFGGLLVRPLKQIVLNLENYSTGGMPNMPTTRKDEIGILARALKSMADNVFSSHQQLHNLNTRLEDEVEKQTVEVHQHLQMVNAINQAQSAFIRELNPKNAFELMLGSLLDLSQSEFGFIGEVLRDENDNPYLRIYVTTNIAWDETTRKFYEDNIETGLEFRNLDNLFGQVVLTGTPVISNDPANDPRASGLPSGHPGLHTFMGIPIHHADKLIGMVAIANRANGYTETLIDSMAPFLNTCANLIMAHQTRIAAEQSTLALSQARNELERVTNISPVVFYTSRADGDFGATFISPNIKLQMGYEPEEFTGDPAFWSDHIHPDDREKVFAELGILFEHGHHIHTYRFRNKSGQYRWMQDELQLIKDNDGQPKEIAGYWLDISERKQAELQLLESEQRFRHMADNAPALIWLADTQNRGIWFNKHWLDYTGRSLQQELGNGWADGVHPDDRDVSVEKCNSAFNMREAFEIEFRLRRADGSYGWIVDTGIPRFTEDDEFEGYIGYCWDITERKNAEQDLQQSERELTTILNNLPLMMFLKEANELRFVRFNRAGEQLLGITSDELLGKNDYDFFPKDQADFFTAKDREVLAGNTTVDIPQEPIQTPRGERILHTRKTVITNAEGKPLYLLGLSEDITEAKQVQDELARFKSTLDQTKDCVFMFDTETLQYFYVNQGASFLVGYTIDELMQMHPYEINGQLRMEHEFRKFIQPLVTGKQPSMTYETEYRCKDQSLVPVEVILQYISYQDQAPRFIAMVRDITERKKIDRMKNEFVSTVSHELRTPLTSIRGSLGLISGGAVGDLPEKMQQMIQIASNNTERLLLLINDILDIQKIESGQMLFKFAPLDVMALLDQAVEDNESYARQYGVQFEITLRKDGAHVMGDHDRLIQVLNNLLSNAAKFSPQGGKIELAVAQHGKTIRISVTDHGAGIPEEFQPSLFEQFTQSDASDSRQKGGTGLGLSIVKAIIDKHGGRVDYITRQGVGTTMFIELPICKTNALPGVNTQIHRLDTHQPCILILEDDPDIAVLLKQLLSSAGYDCDIAGNAAEARQLLEVNINHYKAMTLDIQLPDIDGVSFINELRSQSETLHLPIVVVSVEADAARQRLNGGAIGIVDWLDKPIDEQRLLQALAMSNAKQTKPKLLHIDDKNDVTSIVKTLLKDKVILKCAKNLEEANKILGKEHFELILLDISLPDGSGLSLLSEIEQNHPTSKLVIYSAHEMAPAYMQKVHAVLSKSTTDNSKLLHTIEFLLNS